MSASHQPGAVLSRSLRGLLFVFALLMLLAGSAGSSTIHFNTEGGVLLVKTEDPAVKVSLDGDQLTITGAGAGEFRLTVGPHLFKRGSGEVLLVKNDDRVVVQVRASASRPPRLAPMASRDTLIQEARQIAGELVAVRSDLDARVWADVSSRWTTTEAAKLLIAFFRGDGVVPGFTGTADEAAALRRDLARLRERRGAAFDLLSEAARRDTERPASPLCGTWEIVEVRGAGGVGADALELYEPDPVMRKFVAANDAAGLLTGAGLWMFDASYNQPDGVDLSAVVRGDTVYRARFQVAGDEATLRVGPMNTPRPDLDEGDPSDGGFVLHLRRIPRVKP